MSLVLLALHRPLTVLVLVLAVMLSAALAVRRAPVDTKLANTREPEARAFVGPS